MIQLPLRAYHRVVGLKKELVRPIGVGQGSTVPGNSTFLCQYNNYRLCHDTSSALGSSLLRSNLSSSTLPSSSWLSSSSSRRWLSLQQRDTSSCRSCFPGKPSAVWTLSHHGVGARNHASSTTTTTTTTPLATLSSISETPLDSTVPEKPYTVILLQDDLWGESLGEKDTKDSTTTSSIETVFRSTIPRDYGMSFGSISVQLQGRSATATATRRPNASIQEGLQALKDSDLPGMSDAVLVARGPVSSLLAQYYLESYSLKGLVLMDPMLLQGRSAHEDKDSDGDGEGTTLVSQLSKWFPDDPDSLERFRSDRLLVEANAVPMMVVRTISISDSVSPQSNGQSAWESAAKRVADRHGDADGMYGIVPIVDLTDTVTNSDDELASRLVDRIDEWIDEAIY